MEDDTTSCQMAGIDVSNELSGKEIQHRGSVDFVERLSVLFGMAESAGAVLSSRNLEAVLEGTDIEWDVAGAVPPEVGLISGPHSPGSEGSVLENLPETGASELSDARVVRFLRLADGLSVESLALLVRACAHLSWSEVSH